MPVSSVSASLTPGRKASVKTKGSKSKNSIGKDAKDKGDDKDGDGGLQSSTLSKTTAIANTTRSRKIVTSAPISRLSISTVKPKATRQTGLPPSSSHTQSINTNLSAHPRTQPLGALSVLLKLLTSLASRIGGCQYKLTPAEHTLAVYLVGVLDPFVYAGARAMGTPSLVSNAANGIGSAGALGSGLIQQPTEIIDTILSHVESKKDLLAFGLGCKRLHDIVFPRHFEYRVIKCKLSSLSVFHHLSSHRSLARNVRRLEILDERAPSSAVLLPKGVMLSGTMKRDTDLESTDDELDMRSKQRKLLVSALARMTGLEEMRWNSMHGVVRVVDREVWDAILMKADKGNLSTLCIADNLVFGKEEKDDSDDSEETSMSSEEAEEDEGPSKKKVKKLSTAMTTMEHAVFRSTTQSYGVPKHPELTRIIGMLQKCINLKSLEITYIPPKSSSSTHHHPAAITAVAGGLMPFPVVTPRTRPLADDLLMYTRFQHLTSLTLTNLRCVSSVAASFFLSVHPGLEVLTWDIGVNSGAAANGTVGMGLGGVGGGKLKLVNGSLPKLREVKASKDVINAILECPLDGGERKRPLEVIKGFKLSGNHSSAALVSAPALSGNGLSRTVSDTIFIQNLKHSGKSIKRVEMLGWHDMEDIRRLAACVPAVQWLDVGKKIGGGMRSNNHVHNGQEGRGSGTAHGPATNMVEWAEVLSTLPELTAIHGVRFFYEVSNANVASWSSANHVGSWTNEDSSSNVSMPTMANLSMMERSRMRKNDEIAGVLAWKCKKLRKVDHWEEGSGKVIVLVRDGNSNMNEDKESGKGKEKEKEGMKVRWEVRRVR